MAVYAPGPLSHCFFPCSSAYLAAVADAWPPLASSPADALPLLSRRSLEDALPPMYASPADALPPMSLVLVERILCR